MVRGAWKTVRGCLQFRGGKPTSIRPRTTSFMCARDRTWIECRSSPEQRAEHRPRILISLPRPSSTLKMQTVASQSAFAPTGIRSAPLR